MNSQTPTIAFILKGFPRISETFISNEIALLEELGFTIRLISMRHPRESFTHESVRRIQAKPLYLPSQLRGNLCRLLLANAAVACSRPRAYFRALRMLWIKCRQSRFSATCKHLLQAGFLVWHGLSDTKVTRLHAHFAHSPASVAQFAHVLSGLPFGFTAHAKDIYTQRPQALREKLRQADLVITCTEYNRRHLMMLGGVAVHRVYHGINPDLFSFRGVQHHPGKGGFTVLCVARQVEKKGIDTVLMALKILRDRGMNVLFRHVGDGPLREQLEQQANEIGLGEIIQWLGTLSHEQVLGEYMRADIFVLGCREAVNGDRDGIPNVLAESMAVGVPVVATTVSAIPELVTHERTGLLATPNDAVALADEMERLLTDNALRKNVILEARRRIVEDFDNRKCIKELAQVFRNA